MVLLGFAKRMNVFGHNFTKDQPTNIRHISNYATWDREEYFLPKILLARGSNFQKKNPLLRISQPNQPSPSHGKELTDLHLEKRKLCYYANTTGRRVKFN